jgi:hypothetical protein
MAIVTCQKVTSNKTRSLRNGLLRSGPDTNKKMRLDRKELLNEIGFVWSKLDDRELCRQYKKLVEFQQKHEHCRVPFMYKEDESFCTWVSTQRKHHKKNKMRPDAEIIFWSHSSSFGKLTPS